MAKPVCFMVMPFGQKAVEPRVEGAPDKIDFDALWNKALAPVIQELGYDPVRADQDTGAAIILEMLERLFFSDVVVADMTIPNGNAYYEIGIRHASRPRGCLLISAAWSKPLFDVNQMRRLTYPLPEGAIEDASAAAIRAALKRGARELVEGSSPMFQHLPGFPDPKKVDPNRASAIRKQLDELSAFQAQVRTARVAADGARRKQLALALREAYPASAPMSQAVALELVTLLRDCVGWRETIEYIDALPSSTRDLDFVKEQRCLAQSKSGDHEQAIGALEELIARSGDSSERQGLIGGRYKMLAAAARQAGDMSASRDYLDRAITHYENGMKLDLNDFYPTSNLPFLYRERGAEGDQRQAALTAQIAMLAAERDVRHEWSRQTRLTLAFFDEDVERARRYAREVREEGPEAWKLDSTLDTLEHSVEQASDPEKKVALEAVLGDLKAFAARRKPA
jgi:tetratricopeptide (TPR) repeat protein